MTNVSFAITNISNDSVYLGLPRLLTIEPGQTADLLALPGVTLESLARDLYLNRQLSRGDRLVRATIPGKTNPTTSSLSEQTLAITPEDLAATIAPNIIYSNDLPLPLNTTAAAGVSSLGVRADHTHLLPVIVDPESVPFVQAIPFNSSVVMPQTIVTGALTFAPNLANKKLFGTCYARLIANGTNIPTFIGFSEHNSSSGYLNIADTVNYLFFWYDGITFWYTTSQAATASGAIPTVLSAQVPTISPQDIKVTCSVSLDGLNVPPLSAFAITNSGGTDTVTSVSVAGSIVTIGKSRTTLFTDTLSLNYTPPVSGKIRNGLSAYEASPFLASVLNNVGIIFIRMTELTAAGTWVESGNATTGYTYMNTSAFGFGASHAANASHYLPASTDGFFLATIKNITKINLVELDTTRAGEIYTSTLYSLYNEPSTIYRQLTNGAAAGTCNVLPTYPVAIDDVVRLRRTGTTLYGEVSKDGGATFTVVHTWTGSSQLLYPRVSCDGGSGFGALSARNMTAF